MPFSQTDSLGGKLYKGFLVASAFSSMLFPVILTLLAIFLLSWQGLLCVLTLELILAVIPLRDGPPPKFVQRALHQATHAAIEWMAVKVVYSKEDFKYPGPYVLGMCATVDLVQWYCCQVHVSATLR